MLSDGSGGCDWVYNQPRLDAHWQHDARVGGLPSDAVVRAAGDALTPGTSVDDGGGEWQGAQCLHVIRGLGCVFVSHSHDHQVSVW